MNLSRAPAALALAVLIAACGSGGGNEADTPLADDNTGYLPLGSGNRAVYDDGTETRVTGQRVVNGVRWWVLQDTDSGGTTEFLARKDAQGYRTRFESPQVGTAEYLALKLPVVAGDAYPLYDIRYTAFFDYDRNGTADDVDLSTESTVVGFETVTTPLGTFTGAVRLRSTSTSTVIYRPQGTRAALSTSVSDVWLVEGIGNVKSVDSDTPTGGATTTTTTLLTGYQVGTRTGGTLPPR